jgi:K+-sensing histidine kinase KdpD
MAIDYHVNVIFDNAYHISSLLDLVDFETNPDFFGNRKLESRSLHGKFYKASISFKRIAKNKQVSLNIQGKSDALLDMYPVIDILPYLLFDNAIKYSPKNSSVVVEVSEDVHFVNLTISSAGPTLDEDEETKLFNKGFRGKRAIELGIQGSGRGLALAKHICDLHGATIKANIEKKPITLQGILYSQFEIQLRFPR